MLEHYEEVLKKLKLDLKKCEDDHGNIIDKDNFLKIIVNINVVQYEINILNLLKLN